MNNKEELTALIKYLIDHNSHHLDELIQLNSSLKEVNNNAYKKVEEAIAYFSDGNLSLKEALEQLKK